MHAAISVLYAFANVLVCLSMITCGHYVLMHVAPCVEWICCRRGSLAGLMPSRSSVARGVADQGHGHRASALAVSTSGGMRQGLVGLVACISGTCGSLACAAACGAHYLGLWSL